MDPDTIDHICYLFNHSVSCEYLFCTDVLLPKEYGLDARRCYKTNIQYTGGHSHIAYVYRKMNYENTSPDDHTYDVQLRNISSCSVDSKEVIRQQILEMDERIGVSHSSLYPHLRSMNRVSNKTHDSPSTRQSHRPCSNDTCVAPELVKGQTTTGQQIESSELETLSRSKSDFEHCSVLEQTFPPIEKKMPVIASHPSVKNMITKTGQQIEGADVVTLSSDKSNDKYHSDSEEYPLLNDPKTSDVVSPLSFKKTDEISCFTDITGVDSLSVENVSPNRNPNFFTEPIPAVGTKRKMSGNINYNGPISSSNDAWTENNITSNSPIGVGNLLPVSHDNKGNGFDVQHDVYGNGTGVLTTSLEKLNGDVPILRTGKDIGSHSMELMVLRDGQSDQCERRESETVPAFKKLKMPSTQILDAYNVLDTFFASNPLNDGKLSESWNKIGGNIKRSMQCKWFIVYSMI